MNKIIQYSNASSKILKESIDDVSEILSNYELKNVSINLIKEIPKEKIKNFAQGTSESFYIKSNDSNVFIYAQNETALSYGLYHYLDVLGFKWYLPGDLWSIYPDKLNLSINLDEVVSPDFNVREFFGSGGFQINPKIDPKNKRKKDWTQWKRRNRMGGSRKILGHQWQDFIKRQKIEIENHPEYLALIDGKRTAIKPNAKLCISNKELISVFIHDRLDLFKTNLNKYGKEHLLGQNIGVEPSDGQGHCTCQNCLKLGSISNRVFYLANAVAERFSQEYPWVRISILAYNEHADVPSIDIHPKVDVTIIPRGFHNLAPEKIYIEQWQNKVQRPLGLYDYWYIPIWKLDLPGFDLYGVSNKMNMWHESGIDALMLESSYSKGSIGLALYQMAHVGWDLTKSSEELLNEFYAKSFGPAQNPMQKIFKRWSNQFNGIQDLAFTLENLKEASSLAKTDEQKSRINEWKEYVHFVRLMSEFKEQPRNSKEGIVKANETIEYMWNTYWNYMVHTTNSQYALTNYHTKEQEFKDKWTFKKGKLNPKVWSNVANKKVHSIDKIIAKDAALYPVKFQERQIAKTHNNIIRTNNEGAKKYQSKVITIGKNQELVVLLKKGETINLIGTLLPTKETKITANLILTDPSTKVTLAYKDYTQSTNHNFSFTAPRGQVYKIKLTIIKCRLEMEINNSMSLAFTEYPNQTWKFTNLFVPIPDNVSNVIYTCKKEIDFKTLKRKKVAFDNLDNNTYRLNLNSGVKKLRFQERSSKVSFLNIPNLFFIYPDSMFTYDN